MRVSEHGADIHVALSDENLPWGLVELVDSERGSAVGQLPLLDLVAFLTVFRKDGFARLALSPKQRIQADATRALAQLNSISEEQALRGLRSTLRMAYIVYMRVAVEAYSALLDNNQDSADVGTDWLEYSEAIRRMGAALGYKFIKSERDTLALTGREPLEDED